MAILGGIIAGVVAGLLYNKFHKIKLPEWLRLFLGKRLVPIITSIVMLLLGLVFGQIWPTIQSGIDSVAHGMVKIRFSWCWFIRIIKPFINSNRFTPRNEYILLVCICCTLQMQLVILFMVISHASSQKTISRYVYDWFLPNHDVRFTGSMFRNDCGCETKKRKMVTGMLGGLALTSFLTGITEPIEFSFMFLSPVLYGIHAVLTGLSLFITTSLGIHDGFII